MTVPTISVSGLMSGLDTATIVQQLMYLERQPVRDLQSRISTAESQRSAYQDVNTKLLALKTAVEALSSASITDTKTATSSDPSALSVAVTSETPSGVYTFRVTQLAQTSQAGSNGFADADTTPVGAGVIDISVGGVSIGTVTVGATDTLQDVADAINALGGDVVADIVNTGSGATPCRLVLTSKVSGSPGQITVTENIGALSFTNVTLGQDAVMTMGATTPITLTSPDGVFSDVLPGMTVTATGISRDARARVQSITVTVGPAVTETDLVEKINSFVSAYNGAVTRIRELTLYDTDAEKAALLQGDITLRFVSSDLSRLAVSPVAGLPDAMSSLFQMGVRLDREGLLTVDDDILAQKVSEDPEGVKAVFAGSGGLAERLSDRLDYITASTGGQIAGAIERIGTQITGYQDQIDRIESLLEAREERLRAEFVRMETALAALQSQSAFLQQQLLGTSSASGGYSLLG